MDRWIVAGDLVGYGPYPNECVERVAGLDATCVVGNHDLIALDRLSDERCIELAAASLRWTRKVLGDEARSYLESLPVHTVAAGGVVVAHGSLDDPQYYTSNEAKARQQLAQLTRWPDAHLVTLGHTHRPLAVSAEACPRPAGTLPLPGGSPMLLNPGAVGQAREIRARARALILDLEAGEATFVRIPYDVEACRAALRDAGLSPKGCHLPPSPRRAARRVVDAVSGRLRRLRARRRGARRAAGT